MSSPPCRNSPGTASSFPQDPPGLPALHPTVEEKHWEGSRGAKKAGHGWGKLAAPTGAGGWMDLSPDR